MDDSRSVYEDLDAKECGCFLAKAKAKENGGKGWMRFDSILCMIPFSYLYVYGTRRCMFRRRCFHYGMV
jgi:hypothetical protein